MKAFWSRGSVLAHYLDDLYTPYDPTIEVICGGIEKRWSLCTKNSQLSVQAAVGVPKASLQQTEGDSRQSSEGNLPESLSSRGLQMDIAKRIYLRASIDQGPNVANKGSLSNLSGRTGTGIVGCKSSTWTNTWKFIIGGTNRHGGRGGPRHWAPLAGGNYGYAYWALSALEPHSSTRLRPVCGSGASPRCRRGLRFLPSRFNGAAATSAELLRWGNRRNRAKLG